MVIGDLVIMGSGIYFFNLSDQRKLFKGTVNGSVTLYHDDVKKFETKLSDGIIVTGSVDVSYVYLNDGEILYYW